MSSHKKHHSLILSGIVLFLTACSSQPDNTPVFPQIDMAKTPLVHYAFIGAIEEAPVQFPEAWNRDALRKLNLTSITLFTKGGKNPEDTLDKFTFHYSNDWHSLHYSGFRYAETPTVWSKGLVTFTEQDTTGSIHFSRHFGIEKNLQTSILKTDNGYLFLRDKLGSGYDTTWLIGTLDNPTALISKIGHSIFSAEIFLPEGSGSRAITDAMNSLPFDREALIGATCSVVFVRNHRPKNAYLLDDQYSQVARIRNWTYTPYSTISSYREWSGSLLIKNISWNYGTAEGSRTANSQLPISLTVDRKTYFCCYQ